jgi:hypothetical protein
MEEHGHEPWNLACRRAVDGLERGKKELADVFGLSWRPLGCVR